MEAIRQSVDLSALVIAVIGALFSIASALYFTSRKISAEFRYRRHDLSNTYAEKILAERLRLYPEIWSCLSSYAKQLERFPILDGSLPNATVRSLRQFNADVQEWDSKHAYILSANAGIASHALKVTLRELLLDRAAADENEPITREEYLRVYPALSTYEIALRTDIGVYEVEEMEARERLSSYREVAKRSRIKMS